MEKGEREVARWFDIPEAQMVQWLIANTGAASRVYVVTTQAPPEFPDLDDRWPRLVQKQTDGS